jgi:glucose/arabinose dehydrogenase
VRAAVACRSLGLAAIASLALATSSPAAQLALAPVGTYDQPTYVTSAPADPEHLFIVERAGTIVQTQAGTTKPFADLRSLVSCCTVERGLLSMALAPDFASTGRFYVAYTGVAAAGGSLGDVHLDELTANGDSANLSSRRPVLTIAHSQFANHNGGQLEFGPDGYLWLSTGDGGGTGDPQQNSQNPNSLLGKLLRISPRPGGTAPYTVPADNPFVGVAGADEVWSFGFRNPWRFSFDRLTGALLVGDVGQGAREEVDYMPPASGLGRGANFGWNCREGLIPYQGAPASCAAITGFTDPIFDYTHTNPGGGAAFGCSITGGYVVRDKSLGELYGRYLYSDYCNGQLRSLSPALPRAAGDRGEGLSVTSPVSFGEDSSGRIFVVSGAGPVYRLTGPTAGSETLRIGLTGSGAGFVQGPQFRCPPDCAQSFDDGTRADLEARPSSGSYFAGWRGDCSATGGCTVLMDRDRSVSAIFNLRVSTEVRLTAASQRVEVGHRAALSVHVSPCQGRSGDPVELRRNGVEIDSKRLDQRCGARFHPRLLKGARFRAIVPFDLEHRAGASAHLRLRVHAR